MQKMSRKSMILKSASNSNRHQGIHLLHSRVTMYSIQGIGAAAGMAIGKIQIIRPATLSLPAEVKGTPADEWQRLLAAQRQSLKTMSDYHEQAQQRYSQEMAKIYKAYWLMLDDEVYLDNIKKYIDAGERAERAVALETERLCCRLSKTQSAYLAQRAEDIRAVQHRLIAALGSADKTESPAPQEARIIIAEKLTPADTLVYTPEQLQGFVTCGGGITSHSVILAKELGIPAIVGAEMALDEFTDGQWAVLDADRGRLYIDPDETCLAQYRQMLKAAAEKEEQMKRFVSTAALQPGQVSVCANITALSEAQKALEQGADGIGLVRTEFLYMNRDAFPSESEQFTFYQTLALMMPEKEIVIRTLDIGGDKQAAYIGIPAEENPFLGHRNIRYCLENPDVLSCQLRAILRASAFGQLKILIPMVTTLEELFATRAQLEREKARLRQERIAFDENIALGVMIETPAAAIMADVFAAHCHFFSIGSNDLTQYITASDRNNSKTQHLYCPHNPAVLRMINHVISSARKHAIPVHVCGEIASDEKMIPYLIAASVDELSVTPLNISKVKYLVAKSAQTSDIDWLANIMSICEIANLERELKKRSDEVMAL
ncbi:phosphoenolpyruvate--protein phosphotransferase [Candidatus Sodalis endolongispinus]|uniref:Phosphoenolpyruvate-protein phosphotransferase n=1 Tax=Candidatus Sodalis endolongispinus TaxID=2812662 RepID=A0ABS5YBL3_9GAMM|nr:phosphoenolpyruvate--protein phosphotransferase [Candidatus Sodalis endolongispinus]MBT9431999.1 phosphoenolpyruvate--protein phosphotransferase [Candidatus Sodalis endolongispinus]